MKSAITLCEQIKESLNGLEEINISGEDIKLMLEDIIKEINKDTDEFKEEINVVSTSGSWYDPVQRKFVKR